jgi:hypothetical protein
MQFPDLPDIWEEEEKNTQLNPIEFTVKPTGETTFKGIPTPEIIRELMVSSDYQRDQNRRYETEIKKQSQGVEIMIIGFLGLSIIVSFLCLFLSSNNKQNQGEFHHGRTGGNIRRTCTY